MRMALVAWNDRLAPLFDTAVWWMLVDCTADGRRNRRMECLMTHTPQEKAQRAVELGVELLVCGAISQPLEAWLLEHRIAVRSFLTGGLEELVAACRREDSDLRAFSMPGCAARCRKRRRNGSPEAGRTQAARCGRDRRS